MERRPRRGRGLDRQLVLQHPRVLARGPSPQHGDHRERGQRSARSRTGAATQHERRRAGDGRDATISGAPRCVSPWNRLGESACSTKTPAARDDAGGNARRRVIAGGTDAASSGLSRRSASAARYTAARNAHTTTAMTPPSTDVGFSQLVEDVARAPSPAGTRPDATPPTTAPRKNGVITDDDANATPKMRRELERVRRLAERERGAAQDDADRRERQRDVQRRHDRRERAREAGPQHRRARRSTTRGSPPTPGRSTARSACASARRARRCRRRDPRTRRRSRRRRAARTA